MQRNFLRAALFTALALVACGADPVIRVPALNVPATAESHPGKFVWTDLFTADPAASQKFYAALFGWEWRAQGTEYAVAYVNGLPVAGAVHRPTVKGETARARWIGFVAVTDLAATIKSVSAQGGRTALGPRDIPDRGQVAVFADAEGALFGGVQSSSGDPADYALADGEWAWAQLLAGDVAKATDFYRTVFGYEVQAAPGAAGQKNAYFMREGFARAGLAQLAEKSDRKPQWLGFIRVTSVADAIAKAKTLGGSVLYESTSPRAAILADPTGAAVGIIEPANTGGK